MSTTVQRFRDALSALISEMKQDGRSDKRIPLQDGLRRESSGLGVIYAFTWTDPADLLFEGATVRFQTAALVMDATVTLIANDRIFLLLVRDLGETIETATIVVDQTGFLDALRRRMDDISSGPASLIGLVPLLRHTSEPTIPSTAPIQKAEKAETLESTHTVPHLPPRRSPESAAPALPPGMGGPFVPIPSAPLSAGQTQPPPKILPRSSVPDRVDQTQTAQDALKDGLLDLSRPADVIRIQQRLLDLGYFSSKPNGVWGPKSRQALSDFQSASTSLKDEAWNSEIQRQLFSDRATRKQKQEPPYVGGWATEDSRCLSGNAPITITSNRAVSNGTACEFKSVAQIGERTWSVQARCSGAGSNWNANIRLAISENNLTWSSERGVSRYSRCGG